MSSGGMLPPAMVINDHQKQEVGTKQESQTEVNSIPEPEPESKDEWSVVSSLPPLKSILNKLADGLGNVGSKMIIGNVLNRATEEVTKRGGRRRRRCKDPVQLIEITIDNVDSFDFQHSTEKDFAKFVLFTSNSRVFMITSKTVKDFPLCDFIVFTPNYETGVWDIVIIELKSNLVPYIVGDNFKRAGKLNTSLNDGDFTAREKKKLEQFVRREQILKQWVETFKLGRRFRLHFEICLLEKQKFTLSPTAIVYTICLVKDAYGNFIFTKKYEHLEPWRFQISE